MNETPDFLHPSKQLKTKSKQDCDLVAPDVIYANFILWDYDIMDFVCHVFAVLQKSSIFDQLSLGDSSMTIATTDVIKGSTIQYQANSTFVRLLGLNKEHTSNCLIDGSSTLVRQGRIE